MATRSNDEWLAELTDTQHPDIQESAIEALRERLKRGIYYYLSRERSDMTRHSSDELMQMSEDFAQDSVLRVLNNLDTFRGDSQFTTWAMKIAARVAVSELRRARYRDFSLDDITVDGEVQLHVSDSAATHNSSVPPERATEREDLVRILTQALAESLTERQRLALEAVTLQNIPMDMVAEQLGTNRNALYKLLHDARKKLKAHLEAEGLSIDYVMGLFSH
jgi:RNA polymerase sigma-70 factor, ECF subfamily